MSSRPSLSPRAGVVCAAIVVGLVTAWLIRPVLHGPAMFLWTAPLVWLPPLVVLAAGSLLGRGRGRRLTVADLQAGRWPGGGGLVVAAIVAFVVFLVAAAANGPLTQRAIFEATTYNTIPRLPSDGQVRLLPKEVAEQIASGGFNSPTERLTDFRIVRTPDGLAWTALRTPDGLVRTFSKKSQGIVTLDAQQTSRTFRELDAEFQVAPGLQITDNLRWRLLKERFLISLGEATGIIGRDGRPLIVVPYTEYEGVLVRRPEWGGVFVVHPDGRIEDLEPEEARRRPELEASGRLYPERLARAQQDAYAYKRGIWNKFFIHEEQTQISDTEANQQPYLIDFGARGAKWVTVAEPYGRAFAANAVFLTDTVTGRTDIWRVPPGASLTGNRRALQTVRSLTIPGVVFSDQDRPTVGGGAGGRFRAVEPRPVFAGGKLVYLVSIIPETANSVSKTVVIDAQTNKQVVRFDNDTDPQAEAKTLEYVRTGVVPGREDAAPTTPAEDDRRPSTNGARPGAGDSLDRQLDDLIERQRDVLRDTERLRRELREREAGAAAP